MKCTHIRQYLAEGRPMRCAHPECEEGVPRELLVVANAKSVGAHCLEYTTDYYERVKDGDSYAWQLESIATAERRRKHFAS